MAKSGKPTSGKSKPAAKPAHKAKAPTSKPKSAPAKPAPKKPMPQAKTPVKSPAKPPAKEAAKVAPKSAPTKGAPAPAKATTAPAPAAAAAAAGATGAKVPPKGITVVSNKPIRKPKPKKLEMPVSEPLIKPGNKWKPLIQSGPKAPPSTGIPGVTAPTEFKADPKARLPKKELDRYREILLRKRNELIGDVAHMEDEALRQSSSGSLSNLPQHMAEQGSDTCEQSLSLDLAQVDRRLIKEIDEAIKRIDEGTYGVCLRTGKKISPERLAEVPWAKYTIEAAREMERTPFVITARPLSASRPSGGDED
jgi:RNA polymerase-binding transcription factor DksA